MIIWNVLNRDLKPCIAPASFDQGGSANIKCDNLLISSVEHTCTLPFHSIRDPIISHPISVDNTAGSTALDITVVNGKCPRLETNQRYAL